MNSELQAMLVECEEELEDIAMRIKGTSPFDRGRKYLTNYALIRASGTAEYVYRAIIADYFAALGNAKIDKYLDKAIRQGSMSATYENMSNLLGKFDETWKSEFSQSVNRNEHGEQIKASAKSLVQNRHAFAHGRPIAASFSDIKSYYQDMILLIEIFNTVVKWFLNVNKKVRYTTMIAELQRSPEAF